MTLNCDTREFTSFIPLNARQGYRGSLLVGWSLLEFKLVSRLSPSSSTACPSGLDGGSLCFITTRGVDLVTVRADEC